MDIVETCRCVVSQVWKVQRAKCSSTVSHGAAPPAQAAHLFPGAMRTLVQRTGLWGPHVLWLVVPIHILCGKPNFQDGFLGAKDAAWTQVY